MKLRLLALLAMLALALPSTVAAADPSSPPPCPDGTKVCTPLDPSLGDHYFYLHGLRIDGVDFQFEGKLSIVADQLSVSTGCNSIGGSASFIDSVLTIDGPLTTTELGCSLELAALESALLTALERGPFGYDGQLFSGQNASLSAELVLVGPQPGGTQPSPDPVVVEPSYPPQVDLAACQGVVPVAEWEAIFGRSPDAGSGSSGSGEATTPGSGSTTGPSDPGLEPEPVPSELATDLDPTVIVGPAKVPGVPGASDLPLAVGPSLDPSATPSLEQCRALLAGIRTLSANGSPGLDTGQALPPTKLAEGAQAMNSSATALLLAVALLLIALLVVRRRRLVALAEKPGSDPPVG